LNVSVLNFIPVSLLASRYIKLYKEQSKTEPNAEYEVYVRFMTTCFIWKLRHTYVKKALPESGNTVTLYV